MQEQRARKSSSLWAAMVLLVLTIVPLYVASIGPAVYLLNAGFLALKRPVEVFYAPLVWSASHCDPLDRALKRYIALWLE